MPTQHLAGYRATHNSGWGSGRSYRGDAVLYHSSGVCCRVSEEGEGQEKDYY